MSLRTELIAKALHDERERLLTIANSISESDWMRMTPAHVWTIKDVLTHLTVSEPGLLVNAQRILEGTDRVVEGFDLSSYNERQVAKRRDQSVSQLLEQLDRSRKDLLAFLDGLDDTELDKRGHRTIGEETTIEQLLYQVGRHEQLHLEEIEQALLGT